MQTSLSFAELIAPVASSLFYRPGKVFLAQLHAWQARLAWTNIMIRSGLVVTRGE